MLSILAYLLFILSVAFASVGVILSSRLRNRYRSGLFSTLVYFQVFIFTFGFYGVWGQVVTTTFLSNYVSGEAIARFLDISTLLGLPFLVFAWLMLIRFSRELSGRPTSNWFVLWFLLVNFIIIIGIGYEISTSATLVPMAIYKYYFTALSFVYTVFSSLSVIIPGGSKNVISETEKRITGISLFVIMSAQVISLWLYKTNIIAGLIFILLLFGGNSFLPVYLSYGALIIDPSDNSIKDSSFEEFCSKFEVSPRESEIIREICNGLSNKEISEKLFITIQTVKDHTHRIYGKTNIKSRVHLINLVKNLKKT